MAVYVDNMNHPYRGMIMCHMVADTKEELLDMVNKIGLNPKWIQDEGTWQEHFDVSLTMKKKAIALGAQEITMIQLGRMIAKRPNSPFNTDNKNANS